MTGKNSITVAMAQMRVECGAAEANLERAEAMIGKAGEAGARIVVLPECLDLGWTDPSSLERAKPIPGPRSERLASAARGAGVYVAAGLTERDGESRFNAAVLIGPDGSILVHHRKINLLDIERPFYSPGDRLGVAATPWGRVGLNICADNFLGALWIGDALGRLGARLIVSPCAWAVDGDHDNEREPYADWERPYGELAQRHRMTVVGVSNVGLIRGGPWAGRKCIGCSLAVGPDGNAIHKAAYGEEAETMDLVCMELE